MFKNLMIYRVGPDWPTSAQQWEEALAQEPFSACGTSQQKSVGWLPPRGHEHGALVEAVGGQWIARFAIETKAVPAEALRRKVAEAVAQVEATSGRHPGKKEQRDMRDDALLELLPQAFPHRAEIMLWLDPHKRWLVLDTTTQGKADEAISSLVRVAGAGFSIAPLQTRESPQAVMANWLTAEGMNLPQAFDIGRDCELKGTGDEPAVIKFLRHDVATDEVRQHIAEGKLPTKLALSWKERVQFALTHTFQLRQITFAEGVFEEVGSEQADDRFDADVALSTGELGALLSNLVDALGSEVVPGVTDTAAPAAAAPTA